MRNYLQHLLNSTKWYDFIPFVLIGILLLLAVLSVIAMIVLFELARWIFLLFIIGTCAYSIYKYRQQEE